MQHNLANIPAPIPDTVCHSGSSFFGRYWREFQSLVSPPSSGFVLFLDRDRAKLVYIVDGCREEPELVTLASFESLLKKYPNLPVSVVVGDVDFRIYSHDLPWYRFYEKKATNQQIIQAEYQKEDWFVEKTLFKDWQHITSYLYAIRERDIFSQWLKLIKQCENPFAGVFLWPLEVSLHECESLISHHTHAEKGWLLVAVYDDTHHLYVACFDQGILTYYRTIPHVQESDIARELIQTHAYLQRFGMKPSEKASLTLYCRSDYQFLNEDNTFEYVRKKNLDVSSANRLDFSGKVCFIPGYLKTLFKKFSMPGQVVKWIGRLLVFFGILTLLQLMQYVAFVQRLRDVDKDIQKLEQKIPEQKERILSEIDLFDVYLQDYPWQVHAYLPFVTRTVSRFGLAKTISYQHSTLSILLTLKRGKTTQDQLVQAMKIALKKSNIKASVELTPSFDGNEKIINLHIKFDHANPHYKF